MDWRRNWPACQGLPSLRRVGPDSLLRFGLAALTGIAATALLGCATAGRVAAPGASLAGPSATGVAAPLPAVGGPGQWLLRAEVSGEDGSASLRLLLRRFDAERFTLSASDAAGQARWEVRCERGKAIWLDPQAKVFCRLDPHRPLRARLGLPGIALIDFPGLLTGEWPPAGLVAPSPPGASAEKPFTAERSGFGGDTSWASWTLWQAGEPVAWFKRLEVDSLLSVRRPSVQVRWRVTAQGDLPRPEGETGDASRSATPASWPGELPVGTRELVCPENAIP
ncbi:MAG: hypothetical protein ABI689_00400 [Thermoanaerobaculia bacterium]